MLHLFPFLFGILERKIYNHHEREIKSYVLLHNDVINVKSDFNNLFVSVQTHYFIGKLYANITWEDGSTTNFHYLYEKDMLKINCTSISFKYVGRGGVSLTLWLIGKEFCNDVAIYSSHQRYAFIDINETFGKTDMCWFLSFTTISFLNVFYSHNTNTKVNIFSNDFGMMISENTLNHLFDRNCIISLKVDSKTNVSLNIKSYSRVPYGNWTESTRYFKTLTNYGVVNHRNIESDYLYTIRSIQPWIWSVFLLLFFMIFGPVFVVFFIFPVKTITKTFSNHNLKKLSKKD